MKKGFTLIELLVVIAIIGILATIVVVNVNAARNKAKIVAVEGSLDALRSSAELFYDNQNPTAYTGFCNSTDSNNASTSIDAQAGANAYSCSAGANAWCSQSTLPGGGSWCVDSKGSSGNTAISCDGNNYDCANP